MVKLALFGRAALLATAGEGKTFQLVELLLTFGEHKFSTALAAGQVHIIIFRHLSAPYAKDSPGTVTAIHPYFNICQQYTPGNTLSQLYPTILTLSRYNEKDTNWIVAS